MSVKKWHQLAEEKSKVEQQIQDIRQKFRMDKINKEFGHLSGEEFFKSITKRLDEKSSATAEEEEEQEVLDYTMDEFDRTNPFDYEFRPDAPSPEPSHHQHHHHHHQHQHHHPHIMKLLMVMIYHYNPHRMTGRIGVVP